MAALPHRDRRRAGPLHPRALARARRVPARHHARLAGIGVGVPRHHRSAVQPACARRRPEGRVPRRVPVDPGLRMVGADHAAGWDVLRVAEAWKVLMARLGLRPLRRARRRLGCDHLGHARDRRRREHVAGLHSNMLLAFPANAGELTLTEQEGADLAAAGEFMQRGSAYQEIQGKNPQTLGYGLTDSPAGLAGWIVEKFYAWTDHDGDLEQAVTRDQILTDLTVYWVTQTINSSVRLYCESRRTDRFGPLGAYVKVPTAAAVFPKEMFRIPRAYAESGIQPGPVHALRSRRSLRRTRGTRSADRRHPSLLQRGAMTMHDLVVKGGTVVDGTGAPARTADVAITDGVVTEVGRVDGSAREVLDADGLLVTPGFVDVHTHFDGQITWDPLLTPTCWHGVTTVVMGNCGVGFAPVQPDRHEWLIGLMEGVEDIPGAALSAGIQWQWETFPEYLDAVDAMPKLFDVGNAGAARRGPRLRDGGARRQERARDSGRHRSDGPHREGRHRSRRARVLDEPHDRAHGDRRRAGARNVRRRRRAVRHRSRARRARARGVRARAGRRARRGPRRARPGDVVDAAAVGRDRPARHVRAHAERPRSRRMVPHARAVRGSARRGRVGAPAGRRPSGHVVARPADVPPVRVLPVVGRGGHRADTRREGREDGGSGRASPACCPRSTTRSRR